MKLCKDAHQDDDNDSTGSDSVTLIEDQGGGVQEVLVDSTTTEDDKESCSKELENILQSKTPVKRWCVHEPPSADVLWLEEDSVPPDESQETTEKSPSLLGSISTHCGVATTSPPSDEMCTPLSHQNSCSPGMAKMENRTGTPSLHQKCNLSSTAESEDCPCTPLLQQARPSMAASCSRVDITSGTPKAKSLRKRKVSLNRSKNTTADTSIASDPGEGYHQVSVQKKGVCLRRRDQ